MRSKERSKERSKAAIKGPRPQPVATGVKAAVKGPCCRHTPLQNPKSSHFGTRADPVSLAQGTLKPRARLSPRIYVSGAATYRLRLTALVV